MYRIGEEEIEAVARLIRGKNLFKINDKYREVERCQEKMQEMFGVKYALLMTSGFAALSSALVGFGVGPGDEVIVPAYTYIATAMAVTSVGAVPVIAEINDTLTLDPADCERKITPRTKAIIPVHIQGFPSDMKALKAIADKHGILILEDSCQADGGAFNGKRLGSIGKAGALSFNQFKIITAGEGGALLTDDKEVFERALIYHDSSAVAFFGEQLKETSTPLFCGSEFRVSEITGAILNVQLDRLEGLLSDLRRVKKQIADSVSDICSLRPSNDIEGDCGTTLAFAFDTEKQAREFSSKVGGLLPIDTGKHIYTYWSPILEKRGAYNDKFNIFNFEENKGIEYSADLCPETLRLLSTTVYVSVNPDSDEKDTESVIATIRNAASSLK